MLLGIIISLTLTAAVIHGLRGGPRGTTIARRPYNNRYNAASGAREDALLDAE